MQDKFFSDRAVLKTSKPEKPNCSVYFAGNILWIVELYQKLERNINWQIFISRTALIYKQSINQSINNFIKVSNLLAGRQAY